MRSTTTSFAVLGLWVGGVCSTTPLLARAQTSCGASCWQADSCEQLAVQAAVDACALDGGGTVRIPDPVGPSCDWSSSVIVDASTVPIHIEGAGTESTHVRVSTTAFQVQGAEGIAWSIGGLWLADLPCTGDCDALIGVGGHSDGWRIHHLRIDSAGEFVRFFRTYGRSYGLIDHVSVFADSASEFLTVDWDNWVEWQRPLDLGSNEAVFVEDCDIEMADNWEGRPFDGEAGGRVVVRHNRITNQMIGNHGFDSGFTASMMSVVAYANDFTFDDTTGGDWSSKTWSRLAHLRGGTGLFYDNHWTIGDDIWLGSPTLDLAIYRTPTDAGGNEHWQPCDGTDYGMCSNLAADWTLTSGDYAYNCTNDQDCIDRIGAGSTCKWHFCSESRLELCESDDDCPGDETCTASVDAVGGDGYPCFMQPGFGPDMRPHPWYEWGNTFSGGEGSSGCAAPPCDVDYGEDVTQLELGRDYFDDVPEGSTLPATCTPFEAFWSSAEQVLYRCESTDTWGAYYAPFPYPHPLQGAGEGGAGASGGAGIGGDGASAAAGGSSAGGSAAGAGDPAAAGGEDDSGCGCRVGRPVHDPGTLGLWIAWAGLLVGRVRRRPSARPRRSGRGAIDQAGCDNGEKTPLRPASPPRMPHRTRCATMCPRRTS